VARLSTETIARASSRHPWRTIGTWIVLLLVSGYLAGTMLGDVLSNDFAFTNNPESERAQALLEERLFGGEQQEQELLIVQSDTTTVEDPAFQEYVQSLQEDVEALGPETIAGPVISYLDNPEAAPVSPDGDTTIILVPLVDQDVDEVDALHEVIAEHEEPGFRALLGGNAALFRDFAVISEEDLRKGETIGIGVALIVLLVVFSAVIAALLPIFMAIFAITVALGLTALVGQLFDFQLFVTNMISMIGLAVGIDYALFIVSRYREERRKGFDKLGAIGASGATANRAVFFSGLMVVLALLGMLIIPTTIFRSLAAGAIFVVLASLAASMTLLPALLGLLGDRINWPRLTRRARMERDSVARGESVAELADIRGGFWDRVTNGVMAHPVISLLGGVAFMLLAATSYLTINTGFSGVTTLPDEARSKEAFLVLEQEFAGGRTSPAQIVVDGDVNSPEVQAAIERLRAAIAEDPAFSPETEVQPNEAGDLTLVNAFFRGDPSGDEAVDAVRRLRNDTVPTAFQGVDAQVLVGGETAFGTDFFDLAGLYQPIVFVLVLGLSFMLLTVVFRSIVVPIKAIILNLLSVFAAYGLVVLVFQQGGPAIGEWVADLFGFPQVEAIEAWLPLFLFSVLFGLSMDYEVFLLSRIREQYDKTGDNAESVAHGLRTTGAIITGAALIMVAVFAGFAAGRVVPLQQMGFGLAVAVLFDATVVRSILVPSTMKLLGDRNWYLPRWLQWLPDIHVEGHEPEREPVPVGAGKAQS
jgi:uncharacterized membrane protein YdfJ with MMPL/SSD domain